MSKKDRKIILIAQCLVNPYCRVHILGQNFPLSHQLMSYLMEHKVGIIQYLCPETTAMGLLRNPQGRQQYDNVFFRDHCKDILRGPMLMVKEFIRNGYRLVCFIGLKNSPTCGVRWGKHKVNRYNTESPNPVDKPSDDDISFKGIITELIEEELESSGINIPLIEFPSSSPEDSVERKEFWANVKRAVEPKLYENR